MKKRFLMMMLAGVLAFSMIGCGSDEVDQEDPGNGEEIVENEDGAEGETGGDAEGGEQEGDAEGEGDGEQPETGGEAGPEGETEEQTSSQKPEEQKPAQQPEQKPETQQPEQKPSNGNTGDNSGSGNSGNSGSNEGSGNTSSSNGAVSSGFSSMTLEEIIKASYGNLELPMTGEMEIDKADPDSVAWYLGTSDITFKRAVASEAMISSIAHSVIAVEVEAGTDVAAVAAKIKENANVGKWVCVVPEQVEVAYRGNIILLAMSNSGNAIIENFKAL